MRKPTIDQLLKNEESMYTLTMLAARRARQLKIMDRDVKLPLQRALDEIANGTVRAKFSDKEVDDMKLVEQYHEEDELVDDGSLTTLGDKPIRQKQQTLFP